MSAGNCFLRMLSLLEIKHTKAYAMQVYEANPRKNTLLGFTEMFARYGIQTECYQFNGDITLEELPLPFLSIVAGEFFTVESLRPEGVKGSFEERTEVIPYADFYKSWNRRSLFVTDIDHAAEPDWMQHKKAGLLAGGAGCLFLLALLYNLTYVIAASERLLFHLVSLAVDAAGLYLSYLTLKQTNSAVKHKLCSLVKETDCGKVHDSKGGTIFGFPLGIIGITYFLSDFLVEFYFPAFIPVLAYINVAAVFFAVWSVLYQKFVVKAWCPICLLTQLMILIKAVICLVFTGLVTSGMNLPGVLFTLSVFGVVLYVIQAVNELVIKAGAMRKYKSDLISLKGNMKIFRHILEQQEKYDTANCSGIVFGNLQAENEIVLLMNPFCAPCEMLHKKLETLLDDRVLGNFRFRFVFTAFSPEKERVITAITGFYFTHSPEETLKLIHEWYNKKERARMQLLYEAYAADKEVAAEMTRQKEWIRRSRLTATPYVLFNGYVFPPEYEITDIAYLM